MYNHLETPREDSPVIFVLSDKLKKVHPHPTDWVSSSKRSVGGPGLGDTQRSQWQDIVIRRNNNLSLGSRAPHETSPKRSILRAIGNFFLVRKWFWKINHKTIILQGIFNGCLLLAVLLIGPGFLLFMLHNCYRSNNVTITEVLYHFFPFLQSVQSKIKSVSKSAQESIQSLQSAEGKLSNIYSNFYEIHPFSSF